MTPLVHIEIVLADGDRVHLTAPTWARSEALIVSLARVLHVVAARTWSGPAGTVSILDRNQAPAEVSDAA